MTGYTHAMNWASRQVEAGILPTAVLGIASADGIVELDAFGASGTRTAKVGDAYPIFSITKPLTAITALRAVEAGLLTPEAPLSRALPEFRGGGDDSVLLRHLLSHTSGLAEPTLDTPLGLARSLRDAQADFTAGTMSRYSSLAFAGVQSLVEQATGSTLDSELRRLASDVGMPGLTFDRGCDPHPVFDAAQQGLDYERFVALDHPGAGLFATASDLLALGASLLADDGRAVHSVSLAAMLRPQTAGLPRIAPYPADRGQDWGLGWNLRNSAPGLLSHTGYGHGGWAGTEFWIYPESGICFVLLTNIAIPSRLGLDSDELHNTVVTGTPTRQSAS